MIKNYGKIIKQIKDEIFPFIDEFKDDEFIFNGNFMRFKFKFMIIYDNLVCNKRINIPFCVISLSSVIKKGNVYYPNFKLQRCFYKSKDF